MRCIFRHALCLSFHGLNQSKMKKHWIIAWLLSALPLPMWGQSTLDSCIRYAWRHNPGLRNAHIEREEARTDRVAAIGKFLPRLSAQAEVGRHAGRSVDPDTNGYTADAYRRGTAGLEVTLSLFEGFARINRLHAARWTEREKEWKRLEAQNELAYRVAEAYYRALLEEQLSALAAEQLRLGERYLKQAERFVELGLKSLSDLQEVKARRQGDLSRCRTQEKNRRLSLLRLKETMGMRAEETLSLSFPLREEADLPMPQAETEEVYAQSVGALPHYKRMETQERAARKEYAAARGQFSPTLFARVSWGSDYYHSWFSLHQLRNHRSRYAGVGISLPLLDGLERCALARKKRLDLQRLRNSIEAEKLHLRHEAEQLVLSLHATWEEHRQASLQAAAETQVLRETERKWEEGLVSVFQLLEARNRMLAAQAEKTSARVQHELAARLVMYYRTGNFIND